MQDDEAANDFELEKISAQVREAFKSCIVYEFNNVIYKCNYGDFPHQIGTGTLCAPKWSSDGKKIAFTRLSHLENKEYLEVYNTESGSITSYFIDYSNHLALLALTWSPDDRYIALLNFGTSIFYVNLEDSTQSITFFDFSNPCFTIAWCPLNNKIAVSVNKAVHLINAFDSIANMELWTTTEYHVKYMDWNPDGTKLVCSTSFLSSDIFWLNVGSAEHHKIVPTGVFAEKKVYGVEPCWVPGDNQILYRGVTGVELAHDILPVAFTAGLFVVDINGSYNVDLKFSGIRPDCY